MKVSGFFAELATAVHDSGEDRELTAAEEDELLAMANEMPENPTVEMVLGETGAHMDGFVLPIGLCLIAQIKRIFGN